MEWDEACGTVWEELAMSSVAMSADDLRDRGIESADVRNALSRLQNEGLISKISGTPRPLYSAIIHLNALQWAKAVEIGVSIDRLERLAKLDQAGRIEAIEVATNGRLQLADRERRAEKERRRSEYIAGEAASRVAATDLAKIVSDTQQVLANMHPDDHALTFKEKAARAALEQAQKEAASALESLLQNFQRG